MVCVSYRAGAVALSVSDDGTGDPDKLRLMLRLADVADLDGHHRGLANMLARCREYGGTFTVGRSRIGGVRVVATIPQPPAEASGEGVVS